ncbi:MAG TPA: acyltransferase [Spirochaetota bacterium]|nr:acyltransferase [Spirochaetota bacterium]
MFNEDEKASWFKKTYFMIRSARAYRRLYKQFASIKGRPMIWGAWNMIVSGPNIHIGKNVTMVAADGFRTTLTTTKMHGTAGSITIGDNVLVMNGVRVSSANKIVIGDDCMLANFCYLMDADWHDIHDRTYSPGRNAPIILERGVWIGDSAIVCKGVRIGENSIVGAGSVVRHNIPANVIATGNPAKVTGKIDPDRVVHMGSLYEKVKLKCKG